jgi:hypothetical protein
MKASRFSPGWDEARVQRVLSQYESQTEGEEFAEIEAVREGENITLMAVPTQLVPKINALISREKK